MALKIPGSNNEMLNDFSTSSNKVTQMTNSRRDAHTADVVSVYQRFTSSVLFGPL